MKTNLLKCYSSVHSVNITQRLNGSSKHKISSYLALAFFLNLSVVQTYAEGVLEADLEWGENQKVSHVVSSSLPIKQEESAEKLGFACSCALNAYESEEGYAGLRKRLFLNDLEAKGYVIKTFKGIYGGLISRKMENAGFIALKGNEVMISYRGTATIADWMTDGDFAPTSADYFGLSGKVHEGFLRSFKSSWENRKDLYGIKQIILDYATQTDQKPENLKYMVTGHSLGGALASLAAIKLINDEEIKAKTDLVKVITFASPRVLSKTASLEYEEKVKLDNHMGYMIKKDIIPTFFKGIYRHIRSKKPITGEKSWFSLGGNHSMDSYKELLVPFNTF